MDSRIGGLVSATRMEQQKQRTLGIVGTIGGVAVAVTGLLGPVQSCASAEKDRDLLAIQHASKMKIELIQRLVETRDDAQGREDVLGYYATVLDDAAIRDWATGKLEEVKKLKEARTKVAELEKTQAVEEAQFFSESDPAQRERLAANLSQRDLELVEARAEEGAVAKSLDLPVRDVGAGQLPLKMTATPVGPIDGVPGYAIRLQLVGDPEEMRAIERVDYYVQGGKPPEKSSTDQLDNFALQYNATICKRALPVTATFTDGSVVRRVFNMCAHPAWSNRNKNAEQQVE